MWITLKRSLLLKLSQIDGINYANLTNLQLTRGDHGDASKITVIGSGWGRSSTIFNSFTQSSEKNASFEFPRNNPQLLNLNEKEDSIIFDRTVTSLEAGLAHLNRQRSVYLDPDISVSGDSSENYKNIPNLNNITTNINRVNTILKKKQSHFTIKTVLENHSNPSPNEVSSYQNSSSHHRCVLLLKKNKMKAICMQINFSNMI